jgi:hypothetical protein
MSDSAFFFDPANATVDPHHEKEDPSPNDRNNDRNDV